MLEARNTSRLPQEREDHRARLQNRIPPKHWVTLTQDSRHAIVMCLKEQLCITFLLPYVLCNWQAEECATQNNTGISTLPRSEVGPYQRSIPSPPHIMLGDCINKLHNDHYRASLLYQKILPCHPFVSSTQALALPHTSNQALRPAHAHLVSHPIAETRSDQIGMS